ncbi:MAG: tetratricopeptide repeat protein [Planctomycetota bacterium]
MAAAPLDEGDDRASFVDGLYERGLYDMVAQEAADFLDKYEGHPRSDVIRYRLASALFELDRKEDASDHFRVLSEVQGFGFRAEAALRWGQCALETDRLHEADAALQRVLDLEADYLEVPATFLLAEVRFKRGKFAEAEPLYLEVLETDPQGDFAIDAASSVAWCAYRQGQYDRAVELAGSVLSQPIDEALKHELAFLTGEALLESDNPEQAVTAYRQVTGGTFADAALRGMGFALAAMGNDAGAATAFETLLSQHPDTRFASEATLRLGVHRLLAGDAEGAWTALSTELVPDDAESMYWKGRTRAALGHTDEALALLDEARKHQPDVELRRSIETVRGNLLSDTGRALEAAQAYETAGSSEALHAAAVSSFNAGDAERALQFMEAVLERGDSKGDPDMLLTYGEALFELKRYDEAIAAFRAVLSADATNHHPRAATRLGWCLYFQGKPAEAAVPFARVGRDFPGATEAEEALYMAGRSLREADMTQGAVTAWTAYAERYPAGSRTDEVLLGLSEMDTDGKAREHLTKLTRNHGDSPLMARALLDLADRLSGEGDLPAAEATYRELLERFPKHELAPHGRYGMAWCLVEREQVADASKLLSWFRTKAAEGADPTLTVSALELLSWCQVQGQDPEAAEASWLKFAEQSSDPDAVLNGARSVSEAWKQAGETDRALNVYSFVARIPEVRTEALVESTWILLDAGRLDEAESSLAEASKQSPTDESVLEASFFLAEAWFDKGEGQRAIPLYAKVSKVPAHRLADEALYKQGFEHLRADDPAAARPIFERLVKEHEQSPLRVEALFLAGESAFRMEDWAGTAQLLTFIVEQEPGHEVASKARFRLGMALSELEQWKRAEAVLADLVREDPDFPSLSEAELWRARALARQGNDRAAEAAYQRVVANDRGVLAAQAHIGLGELDRRAGRTETALSTFLKVAVLYAHDEEVAEALLLAGECLEDLGDSAKAKDRYREIVKAHPESRVAAEARKRLAGS